MTTANLMNVPSVKGNFGSQVDASKKLQEENLEVAEMFAGLMYQTTDVPNSMVDDTSSNMDVSKTDSTQSPAASYERYSYKEKQIDTAKEPSMEEKLEEAGDVLEEAGEEIIDTLCEEYGVDEESIQKLLDDMGLSALDLLNPQNLVSFIVQLTGVASGEELLLDENFLTVMETMNHLAEGLMKDLNVDVNGLRELVAQMDLVTNAEEVPSDFEEVLNQTMGDMTDSIEENISTEDDQLVEVTATTETEESVVVSKEQTEVDVQEQTTQETEQAQDTVSEVEKTEVEVKTIDEESQEKQDGLKNKVENQEEANDTKIQTNDSKESAFTQDRGEGNHSFLNQNANETIVNTQTTTNVSQGFESQPVQQFSSYLSADTVQIMEQIVNQMRVTISNEITTMEMQMNPENLGKVYVNISSEEGVVNAQFHATNEVVKEALEAQVATLRETLSQAGVKVDAIEVTIASHEFERNLEQNHQNSQEQMNTQETNEKKRRNLNLDSLDELSGVMTEEEALVAQIMRDNGNSVDFTA